MKFSVLLGVSCYKETSVVETWEFYVKETSEVYRQVNLA